MAESSACVVCDRRPLCARLLSCLHIVCETCIADITRPDCFVSCSACSKLTEVPIAFGSRWDALPLWRRPTSDEEEQDKLREGDEPQWADCDICEAEKSPSVVFCVQCGLALCALHKRFHEKSRGTKSHELLPHRTTSSRAEIPRNAQWCALHPGKLLSLYCLPCNVLICDRCHDLGAHASRGEDAVSGLQCSTGGEHHKLVSVEEAAQACQQNLTVCSREGSAAGKSLSGCLDIVKETIDGVNENAEHLSAQINETVEKLVQLVKDQGQDLLDRVDDWRWKRLKRLEDQAEKLKTVIEAATLAAKRTDELYTSEYDLLKASPWLQAILDETTQLSVEDNHPVVTGRREFLAKTGDIEHKLNLGLGEFHEELVFARPEACSTSSHGQHPCIWQNQPSLAEGNSHSQPSIAATQQHNLWQEMAFAPATSEGTSAKAVVFARPEACSTSSHGQYPCIRQNQPILAEGNSHIQPSIAATQQHNLWRKMAFAPATSEDTSATAASAPPEGRQVQPPGQSEDVHLPARTLSKHQAKKQRKAAKLAFASATSEDTSATAKPEGRQQQPPGQSVDVQVPAKTLSKKQRMKQL